MKRAAAVLTLLCALAFALNVGAAPLNRADLPANPVWFFHLDCDALRRTYLGQYVLYQLAKPQMYSNMVLFRNVFGFDPRALHGVTTYDASAKAVDAVTVTYGDFESNRIVAVLKAARGAQTFNPENRRLYSWLDAHNRNARVYAAVLKGRIVSGRQWKRVLAALAILDGTAPALSASDRMAQFSPQGGVTFLQGAARQFDFIDSQPLETLMQEARLAQFQAGESSQRVVAVLHLDTSDEGTAKQISLGMRGLIALSRFQDYPPEIENLIHNIAVQQEGAQLSGTFSGTSKEVIAGAKNFFNTSKSR